MAVRVSTQAALLLSNPESSYAPTFVHARWPVPNPLLPRHNTILRVVVCSMNSMPTLRPFTLPIANHTPPSPLETTPHLCPLVVPVVCVPKDERRLRENQ